MMYSRTNLNMVSMQLVLIFIAGIILNAEALIGGTDPCTIVPCLNGGTCTVDYTQTNDFSCACVFPWQQPNCNTRSDVCESPDVKVQCDDGNPCDTASCPAYPNADCQGIACNSCRAVFSVNGAEVGCDHCSSSPCKNGGRCTSDSEGYTCKCSLLWKGDDCEKSNLMLFFFLAMISPQEEEKHQYQQVKYYSHYNQHPKYIYHSVGKK